MEMFLTLFYATIAQLAERCTCNADVVGSSPTCSYRRWVKRNSYQPHKLVIAGSTPVSAIKTFSGLRKWKMFLWTRSHSKSKSKLVSPSAGSTYR